MNDKLKKPQTFSVWSKAEYAQMVATQIQRDIQSLFGMAPNIEVGGFASDDDRPIRINYYGSNTDVQSVKKMISDRYELSINNDEF
ncbi:hypothetical protein BCY75_09525 [Latilactobacillus curvatus]|uniref:hypothetical protein n=1 Tax=Latilactobacillus curvatus TaxID=28038 RepID=UPI000815378B|nr:hypothetical protein [Latilactobacillus curvatus]ANY14217.1 hypothetical protein BCY75_09525 [Latilactobacillus curvatus]MCP8859464.1 hypothetical protein [Latilactobacillus curvatus]